MDIELIPLEAGDLEIVRAWRNSPEVSAYMYTDAHITEEQQKKWFERTLNDPTSKYWLIVYEGKKLGLAYLTNINFTFKSCYWAFYLGETNLRGHGIGAKVEYHVLTYVFENLELNKLCCEVYTFNEKVIKMHEKFGFRREAYYREHSFKNGKFNDVVGMAILRTEWQALRKSIYERVYPGTKTADQ